MSAPINKNHVSSLGSGLYTGFVEWKAPPEEIDARYKKFWQLGFVIGWLLKAAIIATMGAQYLPA